MNFWGLFIIMLIVGTVITVIWFVYTVIVKAVAIITPLMKAASDGDIAKIKELLSEGVDINEQNAAKDTALSVAVKKDEEKAAEALIAAGANLTLLYWDDKNIFTLAIESENEKTLMRLIEKADVEILAGNEQLLVQATEANVSAKVLKKMLEKRKYNQNIIDAALIMAVSTENKQNVKLLIDNGANIEAKDYSGLTCLVLAVEKGNCEIAKLLLDNKADVNIKFNYEDYYKGDSFGGKLDFGQVSILGYAVIKDDCKIAKLLLDNKADPNSRIYNPKKVANVMLLKYAEIEKQTDMYQLLEKYEALK